MRLLFAFLLAACFAFASDESDLRKMLAAQEKAWNEGKIKEFVSYYDESPNITFVGKTVSRGYKGVLERYLRNYPDKLHMGTLKFDEIEIRMLGRDHALLIGKFILTREEAGGGPASGRWTLIAKKSIEGWKFIHDHTSN